VEIKKWENGLNTKLPRNKTKTEVSDFFSSIKDDKPTGNTPVKKKMNFSTTIPSPVKHPQFDLNKENVIVN